VAPYKAPPNGKGATQQRRDELAGLVQAVTAYEVLAIEAARSGSREVALRALLANPLVRQWDLAVSVLDATWRANRVPCPQFAGC
jgi:6-phospho-beta-glucosidase